MLSQCFEERSQGPRRAFPLFSSIEKPKRDNSQLLIMQRNSIQEWKFVPTQFQSFILLHSFLLNIKKKLNGQRQLRFGFYISILARKFKFSRAFTILQSVWKSPKLSHLSFSILTFSTNFCPIKIDQSGNAVWSIASDFQKLVKIHHIWLF